MTITRTTIRTVLAGAVAVSVLTTCAAGRSQPQLTSRPDFVTRGCHLPANDRACSVALRYLAALDLNRMHAACVLLERSTLTAAGGLTGCTKTLMASRGIRIHYAVSVVRPSPLGHTVRFSTWGEARAPVPQAMVVSPAGWIVAVAPEP